MSAVSDVRLAHTADLDAPTLAAARSLLEAVFEDELTEHDWEHCLGGIHALVWEREELVAHASLVQRRLLHDGRALRTGYVEGVAVRADRRRRRHATSLMEMLEQIVRSAYELGALSTTEEAVALYEGRGWQQWRGPTSALTPTGVRRTQEDDGGVYVLPVAASLDLDRELTCDWREGDVW